MSRNSKSSAGKFKSALDVPPVGIAIFDADQRAVLINPAYCASLDLPPGSLQRGRKLGDMLLPSALRGVFGPGDPESQVAAALAVDRSRPGRIRRRHFAGRSFDLLSHPLPDGGHVVCAVEVTGLLTAQAEAEFGLLADQRGFVGASDRIRHVRAGLQSDAAQSSVQRTVRTASGPRPARTMLCRPAGIDAATGGICRPRR